MLYRVTLQITETVVVDAPSEDLAEEVALFCSPRFDYAEACEAEPAPGARASTYRCSSCGVQSEKVGWGAGWRTCPSCGEKDTSTIVGGT